MSVGISLEAAGRSLQASPLQASPRASKGFDSAREIALGRESTDLTEGTAETDGLSDDEESEDDEEGCLWEIPVDESVYNHAVFRVATSRHILQQQGCLNYFLYLFAVTLLLCFNAAMLFSVLDRVRFLVKIGKEDKSGVFDICTKRSDDDMPFQKNLHRKDYYWDCGALAPTLMSNASFLDVNKDGWWSEEDNPKELTASITEKYGKHANLTIVLHKFLHRARRGTFLAQEGFDATQWKQGTKNFTAMPMAWIEKEQPILDLCMTSDDESCGNLESRGVLALKLDKIMLGKATPQNRVIRCREIIAECQKRFTEVYRHQNLVQSETCGSMMYNWDGADNLIIMRYSTAAMYDRVGNRTAITSSVYEVFLALVLTIWWLVVIEEIRNVISWWMVVLFKETSAEGGKDSVETEDGIEVRALALTSKLYIILFIMIPRTLVCYWLSGAGTEFLIIADNYGDLILNSTALAFLADLDENLFAAACSEEDKEKMQKMKSISCYPSRGCQRFACIGRQPTAVPIAAMVVAIVSTFIYKSWYEPGGKTQLADVYACLCHHEGPHCAAAQIMGAKPHVPGYLY